MSASFLKTLRSIRDYEKKYNVLVQINNDGLQHLHDSCAVLNLFIKNTDGEIIKTCVDDRGLDVIISVSVEDFEIGDTTQDPFQALMRMCDGVEFTKLSEDIIKIDLVFKNVFDYI